MSALFFNLSLALRAIRSNMLRSVLTILIIGLGIMALVAILTAIEVMKVAVSSSFSDMGANTFQVTSDILKSKKSKGGLNISITQGKLIEWQEAKAFAARYNFPATVGISMFAGGMETVQYASEKTNPNIQSMGVDNDYFKISNTDMGAGRSFSPGEQESGAYVCVLGNGIATKLWKAKWQEGVGKLINMGGRKYLVVGIAAVKGSNMTQDLNNIVFMPLQTARAVYGTGTYSISVMVKEVAKKSIAGEEAEGLFRAIRKIPLGKDNDFSISQNDELANIVLDSIKYVRWAAVVIGFITLLGSTIGLMNIMLVSVAERTREIGVTKALGAPAGVIKNQFLTESVLISLFGGIVGVVLGILVGNVLSLIFNTGFVVPWVWMISGVMLCALVGIISGIYPALKASRLDPIVALRYE